MGSPEDKRGDPKRQKHSSVVILIRSGNGNPGRGVREMMGVRKPPRSRGMKVRGEINGMRSLYGFHSPPICCACTVKRVRVVLVQAEKYHL